MELQPRELSRSIFDNTADACFREEAFSASLEQKMTVRCDGQVSADNGHLTPSHTYCRNLRDTATAGSPAYA